MKDLNNGEQWSVFVYLCHTTRGSHFFAYAYCHTSSSAYFAMFRAAGVNLRPGAVTYFTDELAVWLDDPNAENNFSYNFTSDDCRKGGKALVKKLKAPVLQAAIDNAGGELQRAGAGGSMSVIGAMPVKKAPNAPALQAAIDNAGLVCCRGEDQTERCRSSSVR
jgi:hypothetical protein